MQGFTAEKIEKKTKTIDREWLSFEIPCCLYVSQCSLSADSANLLCVFICAVCYIEGFGHYRTIALQFWLLAVSAKARKKGSCPPLVFSRDPRSHYCFCVLIFLGVSSSFLHVFSTVNPPKCTSVNASVARYIVAVTEKYLLGQRTRTFSLELFWESIGNFAFLELEDLS